MESNLPVIVYVDDDLDDQEVLTESFQHITTHSLLTFRTGAGLLEYLAADMGPVALIVLDINMPGMDGLSVLRALRSSAHHPRTPVVLFSTARSPQNLQSAELMGVSVLAKPTNYQEALDAGKRMVSLCVPVPSKD